MNELTTVSAESFVNMQDPLLDLADAMKHVSIGTDYMHGAFNLMTSWRVFEAFRHAERFKHYRYSKIFGISFVYDKPKKKKRWLLF